MIKAIFFDFGDTLMAEDDSGLSIWQKDAFLKVRRLLISLTVNSAGIVTRVNIGGQSGTVLGRCLATRVRKWKFPASTRGISTEFPLVFQQR